MPRLHVCSLARIETRRGADRRTLAGDASQPRHQGRAAAPRSRPSAISTSRMSDIVVPCPGQVLPELRISTRCSLSSRGWDRREPMVIHCFRRRLALDRLGLHRGLRCLRHIATSTRSRSRCATPRRPRRPTPASSRSPTTALGRDGPHERGDRRDRARRGMFRGRAVRARNRMNATPLRGLISPRPRSQRRDRSTTILIDRPGEAQRGRRADGAALCAAFRAFEADETQRVAVLYGERGTFCAGADLSAIGDPERAPRTRPRRRRRAGRWGRRGWRCRSR